jgi:hypothetical protein
MKNITQELGEVCGSKVYLTIYKNQVLDEPYWHARRILSPIGLIVGRITVPVTDDIRRIYK